MNDMISGARPPEPIDISREHLSRYCDEISFRWDRRDMDDSERTVAAIQGGEGKRLTYRRTSRPQQA